MEAQKEKEHKLVLDRREKATVTGVKDVISFDEKKSCCRLNLER